jgi:hypothetical protein
LSVIIIPAAAAALPAEERRRLPSFAHGACPDYL